MRPPLSLAFLSGGGLLFLLVLMFAHGTSAQAPTSTNASFPEGFFVTCPSQLVAVEYLGSTQVDCTIYDMTKDSLNGNGLPAATPSTVPDNIEVAFQSMDPAPGHGWVVQPGNSFIQIYGGATAISTVTFQTTPKIDSASANISILYTYHGPNGFTSNQTVTFHTVVAPYHVGYLVQKTYNIAASQAQVVHFDMVVQNLGAFPDAYQMTVQAPDSLMVGPPGLTYVPPFSSKNISVSVLTPHGKLLDLGTTYQLLFTASSVRGGGAYTQAGSIFVSGTYVPTYWIPLTLVGAIAGVIVATKSRNVSERRRLERGVPRGAVLSPRQAVLLAELKDEDPEAYKERRAQLAAIYAERRAQYKVARREQIARDREQRAAAREAYKAAKKRRAEERRAAARAKAEARNAAKKQEKADRKAAKLEAKADKAKAKELGKTKKKLGKARAKQAKVDAKQSAKDAKAQAKADKAAARQAKADAKAAKKAAKAQKDEPGSPPGGQ